MTDAEINKKKAICEVAGVKEIDDVSDGFHTFKQLYYQRMMLFAALVKQNRDKAWKSLRHEDGELCFGGGWFVVGIDTPEGSYTYHYEDKYFDLFDCVELERGKHWDGHTEKDVTRLLSLEQEPYDDCISRQAALEKAINVPIAKVVTEDEVIYRKIIFADDIEKLPPVTPQTRWISVSEELPNDRDWYLGIFKEPDTGWINPLPFICDYVGSETKATTKEYWILRGFTDRDYKECDYYYNLECVAWMPLPESYHSRESEV